MKDPRPKRTVKHDDPTPLHVRMQRFIGAPIGEDYQKNLDEYYMKAVAADYVANRVESFSELVNEELSKALTEVRKKHPTPQAIIDQLEALRKTDMNYLPDNLRLEKPADTHETVLEALKFVRFNLAEKAARRKRWIETNGQIDRILGKPPSNAKDVMEISAIDEARTSNHLDQLTDALATLASPADEHNHAAQASARQLVRNRALGILKEAAERYRELYWTTNTALANIMFYQIEKLPEGDKEAAHYRIQEALAKSKGVLEPDIKHGGNRFNANANAARKLLKASGETFDSPAIQDMEASMQFYANMYRIVRDARTDLIPIVKTLHGQGKAPG